MSLLAAGLLASALSANCLPGGADQDDMAWFKRNCDPLSQDEPRVAGAQRIVETFARHMRMLASRRLELLVVRGLDQLHAHTTSTGGVVLSARVLDFCDQRARRAAQAPDASRSCLAFILGHELVHVANDDAPRALHDPDRRRQQARAVAEQEQRADEQALLYMMLAGYSPDAVLGGRRTPSLLDEWVGATRVQAALGPRDRSLIQVLQRVAAAVPLQEAGTLALEVGRHDLTARLLSAFMAAAPLPGGYPGAEILSDLGYAQHQLALGGPCDGTKAWRFRLPEVIDPDPPVKPLPTRGGEECEPSAFREEQLASAVQNLKDAVRAVPTYVPARINLVGALITAADFALAIHYAEERPPGAGPLSESQRVALGNLSAVAQYLWGEREGLADLRHQARSKLLGLAQDAPEDNATAYNLMVMLAEELDAGRRADTYSEALGQASARRARAAAQGESGSVVREPAPPVPVGRIDAALRSRLPKAVTLAASTVERFAAYHGRDWVAYELDGTLELVAEELRPALTIAQVRQRYGAPRSEVRLTGDRRVLRYDGVAYETEGSEARRRITFGSEP